MRYNPSVRLTSPSPSLRCLALALIAALAMVSSASAQTADATPPQTTEDAASTETAPDAASASAAEAEATPSETSVPAAAYAGGAAETNAEDEDARGEDVMASLSDVIGEPELAQSPEEQQSRFRVPWRPEWPRYSFDEAVLTVGLGAILNAAEFLPTASFAPNWRGGMLFDDGVRSGLRLNTYNEREGARAASDALMWVNIAFPFVVDAFLVTGIGDGNWDSAFQMGLISLEAYVVSLVVWRVTALFARRQRPVDGACEAGDTSPHCNARFATQSFFSNHAVNAFTGAALTCLHHSNMPVFGDVGWDATACISTTLLATLVSALRVMSDFEYLTDVLTGAAIGWLSGYVLPWLLHYQGGARPELRLPFTMIPAPLLGDQLYGAQVVGYF